MTTSPIVRVTADRIDIGAETARLESAGSIGALVSFVGYCRDEGGRLAALELEHYPGMAERELARIAADAIGRFGLAGAAVIHRFGRMKPAGLTNPKTGRWPSMSSLLMRSARPSWH